jgi:hypothetical protein
MDLSKTCANNVILYIIIEALIRKLAKKFNAFDRCCGGQSCKEPHHFDGAVSQLGSGSIFDNR